MNRQHTILSAAALMLLLAVSGCSRYSQLRGVVNRHTGFAHFTRGVNQDTVNALRSHVTVADVPVLVAMLDDRDHVTQLAAAYVLALIHPDGVAALEREFAKVQQARELDVNKFEAIGSALRQGPWKQHPSVAPQ